MVRLVWEGSLALSDALWDGGSLFVFGTLAGKGSGVVRSTRSHLMARSRSRTRSRELVHTPIWTRSANLVLLTYLDSLVWRGALDYYGPLFSRGALVNSDSLS
jgi:hypothetical protein